MDDDEDWQNCSLSKIKMEQEATQFQCLLNDCQKWIEVIQILKTKQKKSKTLFFFLDNIEQKI